MALSAGNIALLTDAINYINTNIKDKIQNQIVWYRGNLPANYPTTEGWKNNFESTKSLPTVNFNSGVIYFGPIYNAIISAFGIWSQVRKCKYTYNLGNFTNGGAITYTTTVTTNVGRVTTTEANIVNGIKNKANLTGAVINASNFTSFVNTLYNTWNSLKDRYIVSWEYTSCHSNCHSSCHGSGGWR